SVQAGYLPRKHCAPNKNLFTFDRFRDKPPSSTSPLVIERPGRVTSKPDCDLKAVGMIVWPGGNRSDCASHRTCLRGWSDEATARSKPSDNGPTFVRILSPEKAGAIRCPPTPSLSILLLSLTALALS